MHSKKLVKAVLRQDFGSFIHKVFKTVNPGSNYEHNWHIELIADYLEAARQGQIKRLVINMPPRALKSLCINVAWPAWLLGHKASSRIMSASYSSILSVKHSLDCRLVLNSLWYQNLFPKTQLSRKHNQKAKFLTTENGFRFATSVGGSATGEGGDYLILDDPHNPNHINSPKLRNKVIDWFEQVLYTRLNDKDNGNIILVMQRLHEEDLSNHLLSNGFEHLKIPAIASCNIFYTMGKRKYTFKANEILHKKRDINLYEIEKTIGTTNFAAQYLQEPIKLDGNIVNLTDIRFYDSIPNSFDYIIQSWDTAIKVSEASDYSVCLNFGVLDKIYYLISCFRAKLAYPELKKTSIAQINKYKPKIILIEDKASGQSLIQDLRSLGYHNIIPMKPKLDKINRFAAAAPLFQAGGIILPKSASYNSILLKEITNFPSTKHDDICDAISQLVQYHRSLIAKPMLRIRSI